MLSEDSIASYLKHDFNKGATQYNAYASLQKTIAHDLCHIATPYLHGGQRILDVGCGTGFVMQALPESPEINCYGIDISIRMCEHSACYGNTIVADMQSIPLKSSSFDLILSSMSLQWSKNLNATLNEYLRILKPACFAILSIPTQNCLKELRELFTRYAMEDRLLKFPEIKNTNGFATTHKQTTLYTEQYSSLKNLVNTIRKIGASNKSNSRRDCLRKSLWHTLECEYEADYSSPNGGVYATWEINTLILQKLI